MSAISHNVKFKFVEFLKTLLQKFDTNVSTTTAPTVNQPAAAATASAPAQPAQPAAPAGQNGNGQGVQIPLPAIIAGLPLELRARVRQADVTGLKFPVATAKVLAQLGTGVVKVTFGEIRQALPHVFAASADRDQVAVVLPLGEILSRLNPALLARRSVQKPVEVPADITSPFGAQGQGLIFSMGKAKTESPAAPKFTAPAPVAPSVPVLPPARARIPFVPPPPMVPDQIFQRAPTSPISPERPITPISPIARISPVTPVKPVLPISPTPSLKLPPLPTPRPKGQDFLTAVPVARVVRPAQPAPTASDTPALSVSLSVLAQGWPDALRQEIVQLNLTDARLALPAGSVESALKRGRVVFAWKVLRSWIRPVPPANVSAHDATELELPLSVLAPLFIARQKANARPQQRVAIDDTIPNLFFGLPKPDPVSAPAPATPPVNKVVDTNYYVWDDVSDTARVDESQVKRKTPTGTDFVVKYATPNEIVSRAAALDGVAGVVIALPDGLMVASRIPPELNGDTLAAFLPQIFAKVSQTTKELRMGELNNLNFTVGNVPWKIFRVNAIFFAAFGRVGEALPAGPLAALAAELDRKNK